MTGDRKPRELKEIERKISETTKHKKEMEQPLGRISAAVPMHADSSDLLRLPDGLRHSGDPIGENPFPIGDPRHRVWKDATQKAEEEWCRLGSESEGQPAYSPNDLIDSVCKRIADKFDVWAKRGVHVVWSNGALRDYDQWLANYAEAWLHDVSARRLYSRVVLLDDLLAVMRLVLTKRVNWWKAEARRYLAEQEPRSAKENSTKGGKENAARDARNLQGTSARRRQPTPLLSEYKSALKRAILIQLTQNPEATDVQVCRGLDAEGSVELPPSWRTNSTDRLFEKGYRNQAVRRKIEVAISKVRMDLRKNGLLQ
jgi:hypothetical protein